MTVRSMLRSLAYHEQAYRLAIEEGRLSDALVNSQIIAEYHEAINKQAEIDKYGKG